jgi:hypothetical protein
MNREPDVEQWWSSLLRYVEEGAVIPLVGRDLLWIDVDGQPTCVPRLLATQLADRLRVPLPDDLGDDPVDRVVRAYFEQPDHEHQFPYTELNSLLRRLDAVKPPAALETLADMPFSTLISTTWDSFLARAVQGATPGGHAPTVVVNSLGSPTDIPTARPGMRTVVHLLGRANPSPDYAITEADLIEFVHQFVSKGQPEGLLKALKSQHVLVIGAVSPWLTRFLLRLARVERLWAHKGQRHYFAGREIARDRSARRFLEHPLSTSSVFLTRDTRAFVDELHRRWVDGGRKRPEQAPTASAARAAAVRVQGGVFLSYAKEDVASAERIERSLKQAGIEVWFDRKDLLPGDQWDSVIRRSIAGCAAFVPLLSKHTLPDGYVHKEWKWAHSRWEEIRAGSKFAFPVGLDETTAELSPLNEWFLHVQATPAHDGQVPELFVQQVLAAYQAFHTRARV